MTHLKNGKNMLSLYRKILRTARTWPNMSERLYIIKTAQNEFRNFKVNDASDADNSNNNNNFSDVEIDNNSSNNDNNNVNEKIERAIIEGENRLAMAIHYGSPYERINHLGGGGAEGITHYKENTLIAKGRKKVNMSGHSKWFDGGQKRR